MSEIVRLEPFFRLTDDDHGGTAVVASLCWIITTLFIVLIRYIVASRQSVRFQSDDGTFYFASFLAVSSSLCVYRAVLAGLGKHIDTLSPQVLDGYYKLIYTAQLLSVLSMVSAKISVVMLFKRIAPSVNLRIIFALTACGVWGVASIFAVAFQCPQPTPWVDLPSTCSASNHLQMFVTSFNIVTDVILALGILPTIWQLKMPQNTKITVMTLFGLRLSVCVVATGELISLIHSGGNPDRTWVTLSRAVWLMTVNHLSVITATIPRTHSFWASLQTGKASTAITDQEYEMSSGVKSANKDGSGQHDSIKPTKKYPSNANSMNWPKPSQDDKVNGASSVRYRSTPAGASQEALKLRPTHNAELKTRIYSEGGVETVMGGQDDDDTSQSSLRNHHSSAPDFGVWREQEVVVQVEYKK